MARHSSGIAEQSLGYQLQLLAPAPLGESSFPGGLQDLLDGPLTTEQQDAIVIAANRITASRMVAGHCFKDPSDSYKFFIRMLAGQDREYLHVVFLNSRHQLIASETLFAGTIDGAEVHPRIIAQRALHHNCAAVLMGHNHPSASPEPSAADRSVTAQVRDALRYLDVRLLDHIVVAGDQAVSLAARGWV